VVIVSLQRVISVNRVLKAVNHEPIEDIKLADMSDYN
jgi:hypothetical protein